jgi:hypothetical protein
MEDAPIEKRSEKQPKIDEARKEKLKTIMISLVH